MAVVTGTPAATPHSSATAGSSSPTTDADGTSWGSLALSTPVHSRSCGW